MYCTGLGRLFTKCCANLVRDVFKKFRLKVLPPKVNLSINLRKRAFALGEDVEGVLRIESHEDFECSEVRCELKCVERVLVVRTSYDEDVEGWVEEEEWESSVIHSAKPRLAGPLRLTKGAVLEYQFSIPIPLSAPPSLRRADRVVTWSLKEVVAVKRRPDATSRVAVFQVVRPSQIGVRCPRCGALNPSHAKFCMNCGAPLPATERD